jgi:hypothetical protein
MEYRFDSWSGISLKSYSNTGSGRLSREMVIENDQCKPILEDVHHDSIPADSTSICKDVEYDGIRRPDGIKIFSPRWPGPAHLETVCAIRPSSWTRY